MSTNLAPCLRVMGGSAALCIHVEQVWLCVLPAHVIWDAAFQMLQGGSRDASIFSKQRHRAVKQGIMLRQEVGSAHLCLLSLYMRCRTCRGACVSSICMIYNTKTAVKKVCHLGGEILGMEMKMR